MTIPAEHAARVTDPRCYADGSIHASYRWLRANDPLGWVRDPDYEPFRVVTRHADVQAVSRDPDLFRNGPTSVLTPNVALEKLRALTGGNSSPIRTLVDMDPPQHGKYRALTSSWFQPGNLKGFEPRIRDIARTLVEKMLASGGTCDFARDVAFRYPLLVIMQIMGLPAEDEELMLRLTQEMFGSTDPDLNARGNSQLGLKDKDAELDRTAITQMMAYFDRLTAERRTRPTGDLASVIANAVIDGAPIPYMEMMGYYIISATAGHDTTSASTAGALWALAENPGEFKKLQADPALLPGMIDEAIRWTTPVKHFMRRAQRDTSVGGIPVGAGEWLMLCYASANRDEAVYAEPDRFVIDRKPNRHVAFGYGAHLCLGQYLGRLEMRILYEELLPHLKSVELAGEPAMSQALFVNGPKRVPIRFTLN
ncbi:MAG: cytochrome P450 [Sphingomonadales bacterium]|nr:cytochrome P450 [Sphingomonadales bacterium]